MKLVVDANVFISALIGGKAAELLFNPNFELPYYRADNMGSKEISSGVGCVYRKKSCRPLAFV